MGKQSTENYSDSVLLIMIRWQMGRITTEQANRQLIELMERYAKDTQGLLTLE